MNKDFHITELSSVPDEFVERLWMDMLVREYAKLFRVSADDIRPLGLSTTAAAEMERQPA